MNFFKSIDGRRRFFRVFLGAAVPLCIAVSIGSSQMNRIRGEAERERHETLALSVGDRLEEALESAANALDRCADDVAASPLPSDAALALEFCATWSHQSGIVDQVGRSGLFGPREFAGTRRLSLVEPPRLHPTLAVLIRPEGEGLILGGVSLRQLWGVATAGLDDGDRVALAPLAQAGGDADWVEQPVALQARFNHPGWLIRSKVPTLPFQRRRTRIALLGLCLVLSLAVATPAALLSARKPDPVSREGSMGGSGDPWADGATPPAS